jgi:hypothetical protein
MGILTNADEVVDELRELLAEVRESLGAIAQNTESDELEEEVRWAIGKTRGGGSGYNEIAFPPVPLGAVWEVLLVTYYSPSIASPVVTINESFRDLDTGTVINPAAVIDYVHQAPIGGVDNWGRSTTKYFLREGDRLLLSGSNPNAMGRLHYKQYRPQPVELDAPELTEPLPEITWRG